MSCDGGDGGRMCSHRFFSTVFGGSSSSTRTQRKFWCDTVRSMRRCGGNAFLFLCSRGTATEILFFGSLGLLGGWSVLLFLNDFIGSGGSQSYYESCARIRPSTISRKSLDLCSATPYVLKCLALFGPSEPKTIKAPDQSCEVRTKT